MIYVIYYFYKMLLKEEINIYELFKLVILFIIGYILLHLWKNSNIYYKLFEKKRYE